MDLEKSVADLAGRIFLLEQRVSELESVKGGSSAKGAANDGRVKDVNYSRLTEKTGMRYLKERLDALGVELVRADTRADSIQYLVFPDRKRIKACVSFSKSFSGEDDLFGGWNRFRKDFIDDQAVAFFIPIIVNEKNEAIAFIIPRVDMIRLLEMKEVDKRGNYHFSILFRKSTGECYDYRNPEKTHVDMTAYKDAWNLLKQ